MRRLLSLLDKVDDLVSGYDPKWTFGEYDDRSSRRIRYLIPYGSGLCFTLRPQRPTAHRANSLSRVLASFKSSVSKPSVSQP
jgi:hypothetical protein